MPSPCQETAPCQETPYNITPPLPTHKRGRSAGSILVSSTNIDAVFKDSVYYIGKVTISQAQAPPKFIDDVLVQLNKMHSTRPKRTNSGSNLVGEATHHNAFSKKMHSFDLGMVTGMNYIYYYCFKFTLFICCLWVMVKCLLYQIVYLKQFKFFIIFIFGRIQKFVTLF